MLQLTSLKDDVLQTVENTLRKIKNNTDSSELNGQLQLITDIRASLNTLVQKTYEPIPEMRILKQIYFKSMYSREVSVQHAENNTFEWIVKDEADCGAGFEGGSSDELEESDREREEGGEEQEQRERERRKQENEATKRIKSRTRDCFFTWLHSGNNVFHISGKAGSGKSTLMKLLLKHPETQKALRRWAGAKQLIFAHFFFWRSGDELQRSLEGFYRSILFEVLKQCPDLIQEIFPEAYSAFSKVRPENSIDDLFFRPDDFEKAFLRLVSKSPNPGYRFCFFIDGLDEYGEDGVDGLDHQDLAESLAKWACKEDIKILASSRPHHEFESVFSNELRIRLHLLTASDISRFCRNMFRGHKNFSLVKKHYLTMVKKVVEYSDGVFLWARLAIRSLLMSLARRDRIDSLEKQLDAIPQDLNKLDDELFTSISPGDRLKACQMMLLVANDNHWSGEFNAISITWLDYVEDPNWPASCDIQPLKEDDIRELHLVAERQLDSLTKGLLEIITTGDKREQEILFFSKRMQFFHRTARDFVHQSNYIQNFSAKHPNLVSEETSARLRLAELWFSESRFVSDTERYKYSITHCTDSQQRNKFLDWCWKAINHHMTLGADMRQTLVRAETVVNVCTIIPADGTESFLHWVAYAADDREYIEENITRDPELLHSKGELSLLLSASLGWPRSETVRSLLELGASPHDHVIIRHKELRTSATVWMVFCACLAAATVASISTEFYETERFMVLEYFLAAGVDGNCFILLVDTQSPNKAWPTHVISLWQLVQQSKPPNMGAISKLMATPSSRRLLPAALQGAWNYLTMSKSSTSYFKPEDYALYSRDLQSVITRYHTAELPTNDRFMVYSVRWRDKELKAQWLEIRIS